MLNILLRATRNSRPERLQAYASFTVAELLRDSSDEAGTLLIRFAKHIALEGRKNSPAVPTTIRYSDYFPVTDMGYFQRELKRTAAEQLPALCTFAFNYRPSADPAKFAPILNDLDAAALKLLPNMDEDTTLHMLYAFLFLIPNWITRTDFYHAAVRRLAEQFTADSKTETFVQLCFYLGLDKKHAQRNTQELLKQLLEQHLDRHVAQLTTMDLAVVCSSAFKTSSAVQSETYKQRIEEAVASLPLEGANDALLVTFIKAMRFHRVRSERICKYLANICTNPDGLQQLQTRGFVHIFAYFADNLWDSSDCTQPLIAEFMRRLGQRRRFETFDESVRAKDISTFLWSCAQLNCKMSSTDLERIQAIILGKLQDGEFRYFTDQLVDCCLSLWMLGLQSRELLQEAVNLKLRARPNAKAQPKVDSRLTVLLSAAAIEKPTWTSKMPVSALTFNVDAPTPEYLLKSRSDLSNYAKKLSTEQDVAEAKIVCPISGINIPGLVVNFNSAPETKVFVELLTNEHSLQFSKKPNAILRLKVRLLSALGHKVITLSPQDLETETYTNLKDIAFSDNGDEQQQQKQSVHSI